MPTNRIWQFNPGCIDQPCCNSTPNPTPCCTHPLCSGYSHAQVTLTDSNGEHQMTWYSDANTGFWQCCYVLSHPYVALNSSNPCAGSIGIGNISILYRFKCDPDSGSFNLLHGFPNILCSGVVRPLISSCSGDFSTVTTTITQSLSKISENGDSVTFIHSGSVIDQSHPVIGNVVINKSPQTITGIPDTIYIDDGLGVVPMVYNGPRPVSLGTASDMWWGCATRHVTGGRTKALSGDCNSTPVDFDTEIVFGLWCKGPSEGYRLYIFHDGCGSYDNGIDVQTHQVESLGCSTTWVGQYNQIVAGSINGLPANSCNPFVWGPHSQSFPATPYPAHPLREIYGDSATWIITE